MKTILTIGHAHYVLPASANVNVIMKALSGAVQVDDRWNDGETFYHPMDRSVRVKAELVQDRFVIDRKKLKRLPQHAGPDANGSAIERRD